MGRLGYAVDSNTTVAVLGYGGPEQTTTSLGGTSTTANWREGAELVATHKFTDKLNSDLQLDYGRERNAFLSDGTQANAEWYAAGVWLTYDFTDKVELAFRQDFLRDRNGTRWAAFTGTTDALAAGVSPELYSSTLTLNYKPIDNVQIRPEVRWDHSDKPGTYNANRDQFTLGMGVAYLF
jgi:hypothetical protein